jgi:hypothetical protein
MRNNVEQQVTQNKNYNCTIAPAITTIAFPLLIGGQKNTDTTTDRPGPPKKPKGLLVEKYELSNDVLKFFVAKGFPKKRWVQIKEIPVYEITSVESFGNELSISWNSSIYEFIFKKRNESFVMLRDQIRGLLEGQRKNNEITEKANQRKNNLNSLINSSIDIVDLSFNILMGLSRKKISWDILEGYIGSLETNLSFKEQTIEPLNMDFEDLFAAIKKQALKETSKEAFNILKTIYSYFDNLKAEDDLNLDLQNAKTALLAYYTLNDLMFAKFVGGDADDKENLALESALVSLADKSNIKVSFQELNTSIDRLGVEGENQGIVEDTRAIFKGQLRLL